VILRKRPQPEFPAVDQDKARDLEAAISERGRWTGEDDQEEAQQKTAKMICPQHGLPLQMGAGRQDLSKRRRAELGREWRVEAETGAIFTATTEDTQRQKMRCAFEMTATTRIYLVVRG